MVLGLTPDFEESKAAVSINRSSREHFKEGRLAHVVRTRASHQNSSGPKHLQGAKVELFVSTNGGIEISFSLCEGWRVQDDRVVEVI